MAGEETRVALVSIPKPADLYYQDVLSRVSEFGSNGRFWGVQVMITSPSGEFFLHRDGDGGKTEAHVVGGKVIFPNSRGQRFNSVSGGGSIGEDPVNIAGRELDEELGGVLGIQFDRERLVFRADVPVFACYQERQNGDSLEACLLGGLLVTYGANQEEAAFLGKVGRFVSPEILRRRVGPRSANDVFRPAFRLAVRILTEIEGVDIGTLIGALNSAVVDAAWNRADAMGATLDLGMFVSYVEKRRREDEYVWRQQAGSAG